MKKNILFLLIFLFSLPLCFAWEACQVYYSDFQWIDEQRLLVLRTIDNVGAAGSISEILVVNTADGSRLPLTPLITGFAYSEKGNKLFIHTDWDIILYDFSKGSAPAPEVIYNHDAQDFERIQDLEWIAEGKIVFTIVSYETGREKILFDYRKKQRLESTILTAEECNNIFHKKTETHSYEDQWARSSYLIQISANTKYEYANNDLQRLYKKGLRSIIVGEGYYFKVFFGIFASEEDAAKLLPKIKEAGFPKAFIVEKDVYELEKKYADKTSSLRFNQSNIWQKQGEEYVPLFIFSYKIEPIAVCGEHFIFLNNSSLYTINMEDGQLCRLTAPMQNELDYEYHHFNPLWDTAAQRIIFPRVDYSGPMYWWIRADGTGLNTLSEESVEIGRFKKAQHEYSMENLDVLAGRYHEEWETRGDAGEYLVEILPRGKKSIILQFHFISGYWAGSVWLKTSGGKKLLLNKISNW